MFYLNVNWMFDAKIIIHTNPESYSNIFQNIPTVCIPICFWEDPSDYTFSQMLPGSLLKCVLSLRVDLTAPSYRTNRPSHASVV